MSGDDIATLVEQDIKRMEDTVMRDNHDMHSRMRTLKNRLTSSESQFRSEHAEKIIQSAGPNDSPLNTRQGKQDPFTTTHAGSKVAKMGEHNQSALHSSVAAYTYATTENNAQQKKEHDTYGILLHTRDRADSNARHQSAVRNASLHAQSATLEGDATGTHTVNGRRLMEDGIATAQGRSRSVPKSRQRGEWDALAAVSRVKDDLVEKDKETERLNHAIFLLRKEHGALQATNRMLDHEVFT